MNARNKLETSLQMAGKLFEQGKIEAARDLLVDDGMTGKQNLGDREIDIANLNDFAEAFSDVTGHIGFWDEGQAFTQALSINDFEAASAVIEWHNCHSYLVLFEAQRFAGQEEIDEANAIIAQHHREGCMGAANMARRNALSQKIEAMKEASTQVVRVVEAEIVDDLFASGTLPAITSPLEGLFSMRDKAKASIDAAADLVKGVDGSVFGYFVTGAENTHGVTVAAMTKLFDPVAATIALDAHYWSKALALTDVMSYLPAKRRNEWNTLIRTGYSEKDVKGKPDHWGYASTVKEKVSVPAFERDSVLSTLGHLIESRQAFFAERIDGLWDSLSAEHLTNSPAAFGKRMILKRVINHYGHLDHDMAYFIADLRAVIAKFMGRDEPDARLMIDALDSQARDVVKGNAAGKWVSYDGGAWKIRMYKTVGNAHMEIHPDMALRLNAILASLHPAAIPPEFRTKPKKAPKTHTLVHDLVPFEVLKELKDLTGPSNVQNVVHNRYGSTKMSKRCQELLSYLGGVPTGMHQEWSFDYPIWPVLHEVIRTGVLPEQKAFQYYPTPENLARELVEWADIKPEHQVLEPSAGLAGIADFLPKDQTTCVELSALHCKVLESKGFNTHQADFLAWRSADAFDVIAMNPPFSDGRAEAHVKHAASLLKPNGVLCAILPSGFKGKTLVEGKQHEYSTIRAGEFKGASVSVVLLKLS